MGELQISKERNSTVLYLNHINILPSEFELFLCQNGISVGITLLFKTCISFTLGLENVRRSFYFEILLNKMRIILTVCICAAEGS